MRYVYLSGKIYVTNGDTVCVADTVDCYLRLTAYDGSETLELVPVGYCAKADRQPDGTFIVIKAVYP